MTGGEYGVRGFVAGYDPGTSKQLWRRLTPPRPGGKRHETRPPGGTYLGGGGSPWVTRPIAPPARPAFSGAPTTGGREAPGRWRPGDNLWVASVIALKPKTGEIVWHYQWTPAETYDFDGNNENVLADMTVNGVKRKVLMHADRNGFLYVLDRTNGQFLAGNA